ncbi:MAG TPA: OB-fold nucleic acid binding domain-containing protein, partial [Thermomicrobiales bacterium]|nr:OB-fold nucleic acid binding domain-containing protein [Thermomicrobiales bacterium]
MGGPATIEGWLTTRRDLGSVTFLVLRDRSGSAQVVVEDERLSETLAGLQVESVLAITGDVVAEPRARGGAELRAREIEVLSPVVEPLPFEINRPVLKPALDIWLDRAPLALR